MSAIWEKYVGVPNASIPRSERICWCRQAGHVYFAWQEGALTRRQTKQSPNDFVVILMPPFESGGKALKDVKINRDLHV
ncbi:hypothetical protein CD351_13085 [Erythrobacter sp. KY5]|nr:hypothetical protein CD351_13085 [Erythrobacter sp. KY5]